MTTRNKRKLAALNKENCEENPRSNMAQNSGAPRSQEDYITQVSEEIERRVTKRLSKEFSRTENRILGALARLDDFLMNPLLPGHSGTTPEPTRNTSHNNQGTNEDGSQNDPHPEEGPFHGQTTRNVSLEEDHDNNIYKTRKTQQKPKNTFLQSSSNVQQAKLKQSIEISAVLLEIVFSLFRTKINIHLPQKKFQGCGYKKKCFASFGKIIRG